MARRVGDLHEDDIVAPLLVNTEHPELGRFAAMTTRGDTAQGQESGEQTDQDARTTEVREEETASHDERVGYVAASVPARNLLQAGLSVAFADSQRSQLAALLSRMAHV
jgi:hypothetical protein